MKRWFFLFAILLFLCSTATANPVPEDDDFFWGVAQTRQSVCVVMQLICDGTPYRLERTHDSGLVVLFDDLSFDDEGESGYPRPKEYVSCDQCAPPGINWYRLYKMDEDENWQEIEAISLLVTDREAECTDDESVCEGISSDRFNLLVRNHGSIDEWECGISTADAPTLTFLLMIFIGLMFWRMKKQS